MAIAANLAGTFSGSAIPDYSKDPLFQAMESFVELEVTLGQILPRRADMPLKFNMKEMPNGDVSFEIIKDHPPLLTLLQSKEPPAQPVLAPDEERMVAGYWYVEARQNHDQKFVAERCLTVQKNGTVKTRTGQRRPAIVHANQDDTVFPTQAELVRDFQEVIAMLLDDKLAAKFESYWGQKQIIAQAQERHIQ